MNREINDLRNTLMKPKGEIRFRFEGIVKSFSSEFGDINPVDRRATAYVSFVELE